MNIAIACPNWVGDAVMATPAIRALRQRFPEACICLLLNPYVQQVLEPNPWADESIVFHKGARGLLRTAREIRRRGFDIGVLLANSFRSALLLGLGRVGRRIGYSRDCRGFLLTDKLVPKKEAGWFVPVPQIDYYLALAGVLGAETGNRHMELVAGPEDERVAEEAFSHFGLSPERTLLLAPGASFGPAKLWPPERIAEVADAAAEQWGMQPALLCSPSEAALADAIIANANGRVVSFHTLGTGLGAAKAIVRQARMLVTTDSGLRFFATAFGIPVVTLFGPTHPGWTETGYAGEVKLQAAVECGPCQKPVCPTGTHECMLKIQPDRVLAAIGELLEKTSLGGAAG